MGFINRGGEKSYKETSAQINLKLYMNFHLPWFINPTF